MRRLWWVLVLVSLVLLPSQVEAITRTVCASGCDYTSIQAAVNAAAGGDVITVRAGETFTEALVFPNKGVLGANKITIRSDASAGNLPGTGVRTNPSYAPFLPKLASPGGGAAVLQFAQGANGYVLENLQFMPVPFGYYNVIVTGTSDNHQRRAQEAYDLTFDRILLVGDPVFGQRSGWYLKSGATTITNSYCDNVVGMGQDSFCIGGVDGSGPFTITNNYLSAGAYSVVYGGADPNVKVHMVTTGSVSTTGANVSITNSGVTLADLEVGDRIAVESVATGRNRMAYAEIATITGTGTTGSLTWTTPTFGDGSTMTVAPATGLGVRWDNVPKNITVTGNTMTKNPAWREAILGTPPTPSGTPQTGTGSLAAGTYYYRTQAFNPNGYNQNWVFSNISAASGSITLGSTGRIVLTFPAHPNATFLRVWRCASPTATNCQWQNASSPTGHTDDGTGTWTTDTYIANGPRWVVKNNFEIKMGQNWQVSGNILEYLWTGAGGDGNAMWLKSVNQDGNCWSCYAEDVTIEYNIIRSVPSGYLVSARESYGSAPYPAPLTNLTIRHNLIYDCNGSWGYSRNQIANASVNLTIQHNTINCTDLDRVFAFGDDESSGKHINFNYSYNIEYRGTDYGVWGNAGEGTATLASQTTSYTFAQNVLAGANCGVYPATTLCPTVADLETDGTVYIDWVSGRDGGNFRLHASSAYNDAAPGPSDLGANIDAIESAIGGGSTPAPSITTTTLPNGVRTVAYSQDLTVTGGTTPNTCTSSGTLPTGWSVSTINNTTCRVSGTATNSGTFSFTVIVTDDDTRTGTKTYSNVVVYDPVAITTTSPLPGAPVNLALGSAHCIVTTGPPNQTYSQTGGTLPTGVSLNTSTGCLTGAPSVVDNYSFTIQASAPLGSNASRVFALAVTAETLPTGRPVCTGPLRLCVQWFRQATAPTCADNVVVGDQWVDLSTSPSVTKAAVTSCPATLVWEASAGSDLSNLNADNLTSGTIPSGRFPPSINPGISIGALSVNVGQSLTFTAASCVTSTSGFATLCYDSTDSQVKLSAGGGAFAPLGSGGGGGTENAWLVGGNNTGNTGDTIFGTTNAASMLWRTNNVDRFVIDGSNGNTYLNTTADVQMACWWQTTYTASEWGNGLTTANGRKMTCTSQQGTLRQAFEFADANAATDTIFGVSSSDDSGSAWTNHLRVRQNGQVGAKRLTLETLAAPTCDSSTRGQFNYVAGGSGVKDIVQVCAKDAGDSFAWRTIY